MEQIIIPLYVCDLSCHHNFHSTTTDLLHRMNSMSSTLRDRLYAMDSACVVEWVCCHMYSVSKTFTSRPPPTMFCHYFQFSLISRNFTSKIVTTDNQEWKQNLKVKIQDQKLHNMTWTIGVAAPSEWNRLPQHIRSKQSVNCFKVNQNTTLHRRNMAILPMENSGVHKRASFRQKQWYRHVHS